MKRSEVIIALLVLVLVVAMAAAGGSLLGLAASTIAFILFVPQARLVWAQRAEPEKLAGVSLSTQFLLLSNAALWAFYGFETGAFWVAAPGIVNGPLAVTIVVLVLRSRRSQASPRPSAPTDGHEREQTPSRNGRRRSMGARVLRRD